MANIRIDTSRLTYTFFLISGQTTTPVDGSGAPTVSLPPGTYNFVQGGAGFQFEVTQSGLVDYDRANEQFLEGRGTSTLVVTGFEVTVDLTTLSHDLQPNLAAGTPRLTRDAPHVLQLVPGTYSYVLARGVADFEIALTRDGQLRFPDPALAGCATITGRTLTITGYTITFDLTALSHDLCAELLNNPDNVLPRQTPRDLNLLPGSYLYVLARGVADFEIALTRDGQLRFPDPALAGCATITGRTLTITGYTITFDLTALSHDLCAELLNNPDNVLPRQAPRDLNLLPGSYLYVLARGVADFEIALTRDGQLRFPDPALAGCATITGRTLTITGYTITFDLTALSHDLCAELLNNPDNVLPRQAPRDLNLLPGSYLYVLARGVADFEIALTRDGQLRFPDPALAGCATITGRTLTITGYTITFDLSGLTFDLLPEMLGNPGVVLTRGASQQLTMVPGSYVLNAVGVAQQVSFSLGTDGTITPASPAPGLVISLIHPVTPPPDAGLPALLSACRQARIAREAAWRDLHDRQAQNADLERRLAQMGQAFAGSVFGVPFVEALQESRNALTAARSAAIEAETTVEAADGAYDTAAAGQPSLFTVGGDLPLLLLPVSLEIVYRAAGPAAELWIRVYPDEVHIDAHESPLTDRERIAGHEYWRVVRAPGVTDEQRAVAWRDVLALLGPSRALWAAEQLRHGDAPESKEGVWTRAARAQLLPHHFVFSGYRDGRLMWRVSGRPIPDKVPAGFAPPDIEQVDPGDHADDGVPWQPGSRWLVDFEAALTAGMAVKVPLADPNLHYDFVTAVGVSTADPTATARRLEDQFIAHTYTSGLSVLTAGTPTNNTPGSRSGWQSRATPRTPEDLERARADFAGASAEAAAKRTALALGIDGARALAIVPDALTDDETLASSAHSVVGRLVAISRDWLPVTAPAQDLPADVQFIADHFSAHVRSRGPLPLLRIGRQPYGILPVTSLDLWRGSDVEPSVVAAIASVLAYFRANVHRAQRVGAGPDQDAVIVDLLSRCAASVRIRYVSDEVTFDDRTRIYAHPPATIGILEPGNHFSLRGPSGPTPGGFDFAAALEPTPELLAFVAQRPLASYADAISQLESITPNWGPTEDSIVIPDSLREQLRQLSKDQALLTASSGGVFYQLILPVFQTSWIWTWLAGVTISGAGHVLPLEQLQRMLNALTPLRSEAVALEAQAATRLPEVERMLCESLDCTSHRVDAWATSLATARLKRLRENTPTGLHTGAYGWVHDLQPTSPGQRAERDGYIVSPSLHHATTAAVLRSGWLAHSNREAFAVNLTSKRIRNALRLLDGIRSGQTLAALLGYRFERGLHDRSLDQFIPAFREKYPLAPVVDPTAVGNTEAQSTISARNVVDGLALSKDQTKFDGLDPPVAVGGNIATIRQMIADLTDTIDAFGDLMLAESVHHIVGGNPLRAGLAAETASRGMLPDEFDVITTPRSGSAVTYTFAALTSNSLAPDSDWNKDRGLAQLEPALEQWCRTRLGPARRWRFDLRAADGGLRPAGLDQLGLSALEAVRTATAGAESPFAKRLIRAARPDAVALADSPAGVGRYLEFVTLAEALRSAIAAGAPLLASNLDPVADGWAPANVDELAKRIGGWFALVRKTFDSLTDVLKEEPPLTDDVARLLGILMGAGVRIDLAAADAQSLIAAGKAVLDSIETAKLPDQPAPPPTGKDRSSARTVEWLAKLTYPIQALIGDGLPLLPVLRLRGTDLAEMFAPGKRPDRAAAEQVADWVRDLGRVRPRVGGADDAMCGAELLAGAAAPSFIVTQAPAAENEPWIATATGTARSSCILAADGPVDLDNVIGLIFDSWSEVLPQPGKQPGTAEEIAGIAFHAARPDARPPQSMLLAVPPDADRGWRAEDVHAVIAEAFELAQVRGLDLTDLPELRGPLPPEVKGRGVEGIDLLPFFGGL